MAPATRWSPVSAWRDAADPNEVIRSYAANPAFRSAAGNELVNHSNPFRRPVRREDLEFLDYRGVLHPERLLSLRSLLGHRILLNIYEAESLFLPPRPGSEAWSDFSHFYSPEARALGDSARPLLENHLFAFLDAPSAEARAASATALRNRCAEVETRRLRAERRIARCLVSRREPDRAVTFLLLQLTCATPAKCFAIARGALGDYAQVHPALADFAVEQGAAAWRESEALRRLLESVGLTGAPRAYWQLYLTSSIAAVNHLCRLARDHSRFFEFIGAVLHEQIRERCFRVVHRAVVDEAFDRTADLDYFRPQPKRPDLAPDALFERLVEPLLDGYDHDRVAEGLLAGLDGASRLQGVADRDLLEQVTWADSLEDYKARARRLEQRIERDRLDIDLDRYVESSGETSTTHVHDEHRLVSVQDGEMYFWSNVGPKIALSAGDKLLIPRGRLHGSVVRSGECTYDQPVISDALIGSVG